jgi:hypothetical protein
MILFKNPPLAVFLPVVCYLFTALSGVCAGDGYALKFDGTANRVDVGTALVSNDITMSAWVKANTPWVNDARVIISNSYWGAAAGRVGFHLQFQSNGRAVSRFQSEADGVGVWSASGTTNVPGTWHHLAYVKQGTRLSIVVDGKEEGSRNDIPASVTGLAVLNQIRIGCNNSNARFVPGLIDEVRIWNYALTLAEIQESMNHELRGTEAGLVGYWKFNEGQGTTAFDSAPNPHNGTIVGASWTTETAPVATGPVPPSAQGPSPVSGAVDVPRDVVLSWKPGAYADEHDVYLGTVSADVDTASRTDAKGVLAKQGQAEANFSPAGALEFGRTYYWRVDEVNAPPSTTIIKGAVWSFTVEPYGYPVRPASVTASSYQTGMGPEKTIDGSGLTGDLHGIDLTTMWLSSATGPVPAWIQYQFDKVYKLYDLKVWNSNQLIESIVGFGAKKGTIEYSVDGMTWAKVSNVPEFAKAPGAAGYAANTTVSLGGIQAKYVKLTIDATWSGSPVASLSEVRFSYVPVLARAPQPATAATGVKIDATLDWRPGREAGSHKVFLGTDQAAVTGGTVAAKTVNDHVYTPDSLNFGTTYYWRVDEVNTVTYPGDVWSFTTQEYAVVDDFESYTDKLGSAIFDTWIDGYTDGKSGSLVGYINPPFAETVIVHGGKQSMPVEYNNVKSPFYSEAQRTFDTTQNWTGNGADTLSLYFRGRAAGFTDKGNDVFTVSASGTDIWNASDQFRFVYKSLSGNGSIVAKVDSVVNTNVWAKAGVMIRQSLDAGSSMAYMIQSAASGASFGWRQLAAGTPGSMTQAGIVAPQWVKLTRTGNVFTAQYSVDGKTWTDIKNADGTVTSTSITMTGSIYIGLCVTSHDAALTTTAEFSNVSTTGTVTGSWQSAAIGAAMPTNGAAPLYVVVEDKAGKSKTVVNANAAATTVSAWTEWRIPLSDLTGLNLAAIKKITVGAGDKASPKAGPAGMVFLDDIQFGKPKGQAQVVNLVVNGGFETGVLAPWGLYGNATSQVVTQLAGATVPENVIEGKYCLYVDVASGIVNFWDAGLQPSGIVFQKGKKYTLSAFVKSKKGQLQVNFKPELAANPWTGYGEKMMTVTETWTEYYVTTPVFAADTAPAGFTFHIGSAVGGFWVDAVRFYEGDYVVSK